MITPILQPNAWTCGAACVCMLTNTTLEDFYSFCGHDGSERVEADEMRPLGVRCFSNLEIYKYLIHHRLMVWGAISFGKLVEFEKNVTHITVNDYPINAFPALITTRRTEGLYHFVLWDGEKIIDPLFPHQTFQPWDYPMGIEEWWPIAPIREPEYRPVRRVA